MENNNYGLHPITGQPMTKEDFDILSKEQNWSQEQIYNNIKNIVEEVSKDFSYKETRYSNGSIRIESNHNGMSFNIVGGKSFAEQFDKDFDKAMRESISKDKDL